MKSILVALGCLLATPALAGQTSITTEDGANVVVHEDGRSERAVVLVHTKGGSANDWMLFHRRLANKGFHVVSLDLRGHGESKDTPMGSPPNLVEDVLAAIRHVEGRGADHITLVGAGFGANLAANVAAGDPDIDNLVLLSPGLNLDGVKILAAIDSYGNRPLLMASSRFDAYASRTVEALGQRAKGTHETLWAKGAESKPPGGTDLLMIAALEDSVVNWIESGGREARPDSPMSDEGAALNADTQEIETTGKRFGEK